MKIRKILVSLVISIVTIFSLMVVSKADNEELKTLKFRDEKLYQALLGEFSKTGINPQGNGQNMDGTYYINLLTDDYNNIKNLDLSSKGITNLYGLQDIKSIVSLNLSSNQITSDSLDYIDGTSLQNLDLSSNLLTTISIGEDGENSASDATCPLKEVILDNNQLVTIEFNGELENLVTVHANNNCLTSISSLVTRTNLKDLQVNDNRITSVEGVGELKELQTFAANNNKISDISKIASKDNEQPSKISRLYLNNNEIENVDVLNYLPALTLLDLSGNHISTVPFVLRNLIINKSLDSLNLKNQTRFYTGTRKSIDVGDDNDLISLGEWNKDGAKIEIQVENGELNQNTFTFVDTSKEGKIKIKNGIFDGSSITLKYAGLENVKDDSVPGIGGTPSDATGGTSSTSGDKGAQGQGTTSSDSTTAKGKMPYTGMTGKVIAIIAIVTALVASSLYVDSKNKKARK